MLLFGGIETTEAMIANAFLHLLGRESERALVGADPRLVPGAVEESLRLEPAAAVIDRYATRDTELAGASIRQGDLVTLSLAGANRDPAVFEDPDAFESAVRTSTCRWGSRMGHTSASGMHLARLETRIALDRALTRLPGLRLDPARPSVVEGLVFRKPAPVLWARWDW